MVRYDLIYKKCRKCSENVLVKNTTPDYLVICEKCRYITKVCKFCKSTFKINWNLNGRQFCSVKCRCGWWSSYHEGWWSRDPKYQPHNKGKTKDNYSALRKVSNKLKGRNKTNDSRVVENAKKISLTRKENIANGKITFGVGGTYDFSKRKISHRCGTGKGGYRNDIGYYVRSRWEANYARICKLVDKHTTYESLKFFLKSSNGTVVVYTPDFIHKRIIELKGFWRKGDKLKIELFRQQYPKEAKKLVIIDAKRYNKLKSIFKPLIENWE